MGNMGPQTRKLDETSAQKRPWYARIILGLALAAGCSGTVSAPTQVEKGSAGDVGPARPPQNESPIDGPDGPPATLRPAPAHIRRLTAVEISNSVRDAFFAGSQPAQVNIIDEVARHNFDNVFEGLDVSVPFALQLATGAEAVAGQVIKMLPTVLPCAKDIAQDQEHACLGEFITRYGRRMFRGKVTLDQRAALQALYDQARPRGDFATAMGVVVEGMMHSPTFLFRTEIGGAPGEAVSPLTSQEIASALSYFLWRSGPDDALLDAADVGLRTRNSILEQAHRLLGDVRARGAVRDFFWQWLEISDVARGVSKNDLLFSPALVTSMLEESRLLIEDVAFGDRKGSFADLLTAANTFADGNVGQLYGGVVTKGSTFNPLTLDKTRRLGLLTTPAFIAAQTSSARFSPIFPGVFVRRKMFCQVLPEPPPGIPPPSIDPNLTTRERFAAHSDSPSCQACHKSIDDIGWAFERFDVIGRDRDTEKVGDRTVALSARGKLVDTDVDGTFEGAPELVAKLANSQMVHDCFVSHLLEFMLGRDTGNIDDRLPVDKGSIAAVAPEIPHEALIDVLAALTVTNSFLYRDARNFPGGL